MADIINLAQFEFDTDRLEKGLEEMQKQLFELTKRQQELNAQSRAVTKTLAEQEKESARLVQNFKNGSSEYQRTVQEMYKLEKFGKQNTQTYKDLNNQKRQLVSNFKQENAEYQQTTQSITELTNKEQGLFLATKDLQIERQAVNAQYRTATNLYKSFMGTEQELLSLQEVINQKVNEEVTTREEAKRVNGELNKIKDQLNVTNDDELKLLDQINERINANNQLLKETGSEREKQVSNVGNYTNSIIDAYKALEAEKEALEQNKIALQETINETSKGTEEYKILNQQLNVLNVQINNVTSEMNKAKGETNDFTKEIQDGSSNLDVFNGGLSGFIQRSQEAGGTSNLLINSFKGIVSGIIGMTKATLAFIATPIGAVIAVIGAVLAAVVTYLKDSKEGMDMLTSVTRPLSAMLQTLIGILQRVGKLFVDAFMNPMKYIKELYEFIKDRLLNQLQAFAKIIEGIFTLNFSSIKEGFQDITNQITEDFNSVKDAVIGVVDEMKEGYRIGQEIDKITKEIEDKEIEMIETRAKNNRALAEQRAIMNDTNSSMQDKLKANEEEYRLIQQIENEEQQLLQLRIRQLELKQSMTEATREDLRELAELRAQEDAFAQKRAESQNRHFRNQKRLQGEAHNERMKQIDAEIAKQREQLDLWIAQQGDQARTLEERLELQEEISKREQKILDDQLKNNKITREKYDLEVLKLTQQTAKLQADIAVELAKDNLDTFINENKSRLEQGQLLTDALLDQERERLKALQDERDAFAQIQFENGLINSKEYNDALLSSQRTYLEEETALRDRYNADQQTIDETRRAEEFQAQMLQLEENLASEFQLRQAQEDFRFNEERLKLEQRLADGLITEENYQLALNNIKKQNELIRAEIDRAEFENKLQLASSTFANLASIFGAETEAGKAMAVVQATIDTYKAATSAYSAMSGIPIVGPALGAVAAGAAVASGLANVKKITATKTPTVSVGAKGSGRLKGYATGGVITDGFGIRRNNGDNVLITARTGEAVLNERQQAFLGRDLLSLAGVPGFANGGRVGVPASSLSSVQNSVFNNPNLNTDEFYTRIENAVQTGAETGSSQGTFRGSQEGITDLSSNRAMQSNSYLN